MRGAKNVTIAKPTEEQFEAVWDFLQRSERKMPDAVRNCWQRVLWAGKTAIDNACDPNASVLQFKPEIEAAMKAAGLEV